MLLMLMMPRVWADVIVLQNGDRLTGVVDSISGGKVLFKSAFAGPVSVNLAAIARLTTEGIFDVNASGEKLRGQFLFEDDQQLIGSAGSARPIAVDRVRTASQNLLVLEKFVSSWDSRIDLAANFSNGNTNTQQFSTVMETILKQENYEHGLTLRVAKEKAEKETSKDELDLAYDGKVFISSSLYASANANYFEDGLREVDSRITLGVGVGNRFWDNSFGMLYSSLGVSYVREDSLGNVANDPAIRWSLDYKRYLLAKQLELFHNQSFLHIASGNQGEVFKSSSGIRYALNTRVSLLARLDFQHETKPAAGSGKSDVAYNLGVGAKF